MRDAEFLTPQDASILSCGSFGTVSCRTSSATNLSIAWRSSAGSSRVLANASLRRPRPLWNPTGAPPAARARTALRRSTQLHVEIEPTANDVQVVVDQSRQCAAGSQVDNPCRRASQGHHVLVAVDRREDAVRDSDSRGRRLRAIQRGEASFRRIKSAPIFQPRSRWHRSPRSWSAIVQKCAARS
jgi:hypothetical protein